MAEAYIVAAARTAGGKRGGRVSGWHPVDLGAEILKALVRGATSEAELEFLEKEKPAGEEEAVQAGQAANAAPENHQILTEAQTPPSPDLGEESLPALPTQA